MANGKIETVTVVGLGALGIMYADFFTRKLGKENVNVIADAGRVERYKNSKITANGIECDLEYVTPETVTRKSDLVIVCVKSTALGPAAELTRAVTGPETVIVSALNGISSEEFLEEKVGSGIVIDCVSQGMDALREGTAVTYSKFGYLCVGIKKNEAHKQAAYDRLRAFFDETGFDYHHEEDIKYRMWCKWMLNVGVNQVVMVKEGTFATVQQEGEARQLMKSAMREVVALAKLEGMDITEETLEFYVSLVDGFMPHGMPSMRQDGLARRLTEVDLFAGTVIAKAEKFGIEVPVNRALLKMVRELEAGF